MYILQKLKLYKAIYFLTNKINVKKWKKLYIKI